MNQPTLKQRLDDIRTNPTVLSFYAKTNCKKCNGRGELTINAVHPNIDRTMFCDCVYKAIRKEMSEQNG